MFTVGEGRRERGREIEREGGRGREGERGREREREREKERERLTQATSISYTCIYIQRNQN